MGNCVAESMRSRNSMVMRAARISTPARFLDPASEQSGSPRGPWGHPLSAGRWPSVDLDIGVGPQIKCLAHRIAIPFPEQGLDAGAEADLL